MFYLPGSHAVLPVDVISHAQYLPLLRVLNLFGGIGGLQGKRKSLKVWFGNTQIEVRENNRTVRLNNIRLKLADPVRIQNGEWKVPVDFLTTVLPTLLNQAVEYQVGGGRVFIGDVKPATFTVGVESIPGGTRLTLHFTQKIDLGTAARNGKWILFLGSHPVEPLESTLRFQNPYISELHFDDRDGVPKLILTPSSGNLDFYPSLTDGGKVLVAEVKRPSSNQTVQRNSPPARPQAVPFPGTTPATAESPETSIPPSAAPELPVVVLDAGHGGSDAGARGANGLLEKNLAAQIVARVRMALIASNRFKVVLTRIGDVNLSFDQRETAANIAHPVAFISFHAGDLGPSIPHINVYTYQPSAPSAAAPAPGASPLFVPWDSVQQTYTDRSHQLATVLQQQLEATTHDAGNPPQSVPVRILRSIAAPAVAIEVGSLASDTDPAPLTSQSFQDQIAAGVVRALTALQGGTS